MSPIFFPLNLTRQMAIRKNEKLINADNAELLKPIGTDNLSPINAPIIMHIIGNTYKKKVAFKNRLVLRLNTTLSPSFAPARLMTSTSISSPIALQESFDAQEAHASFLVVFTMAVVLQVLITKPCSVANTFPFYLKNYLPVAAILSLMTVETIR